MPSFTHLLFFRGAHGGGNAVASARAARRHHEEPLGIRPRNADATVEQFTAFVQGELTQNAALVHEMGIKRE